MSDGICARRGARNQKSKVDNGRRKQSLEKRAINRDVGRRGKNPIKPEVWFSEIQIVDRRGSVVGQESSEGRPRKGKPSPAERSSGQHLAGELAGDPTKSAVLRSP